MSKSLDKLSAFANPHPKGGNFPSDLDLKHLQVLSLSLFLPGHPPPTTMDLPSSPKSKRMSRSSRLSTLAPGASVQGAELFLVTFSPGHLHLHLHLHLHSSLKSQRMSSRLSTLAPGASLQGAEQLRSLRSPQKHLLRMPTEAGGRDPPSGFLSHETYYFQHCPKRGAGGVDQYMKLWSLLHRVIASKIDTFQNSQLTS